MPNIDQTPGAITIRPLASGDFALLVTWINAPHVARWWDRQVDLQSVVAKYGPRLLPDSPTRVYVITLNGRPVGIIQCYRHRSYSDWGDVIGIENAAGIDYLIGEPECIGKGIGPVAISLIRDVAFKIYPDVEVVVSAPQRDNHASCRALEKAGFERLAERKLDLGSNAGSGVSYVYACVRAGPSQSDASDDHSSL